MPRIVEPKVVIVSTSDDVHAYAVSQTLQNRFACSSVVLDLSRYPNQQTMTIEREGPSARCVLSDPYPFTLSAHQTVWWRRPEPFSADENVRDARLRTFVRRECQTTLLGAILAAKCRIVNALDAEERASHKIFQLHTAQACGFNTPRTLVTNNPQEVLDFLERIKKVIYKPQTDARYHMAETRLLDAKALEKVDLVSLAPVVFQEFIPAAYDIRLTVAGRKLFATKILSQADRPKIDWRVDLMVPMEPMKVPDRLIEPTLRLISLLQLDYGALDLRVTPEGETYFFEVNPTGQFLFCELNGKLEITEALCEVLIA